MLRQYESVFITTPVLSAGQMKEAVEKFRGLITESGGVIVNEEDWGLRKLAYPIQNKNTGFYYLMEYQVDPQIIEKLEIQFRRDERVIRFLTFKMDKYAVAYSEKRRNKLNKTEEKAK